MGLSGRLDDAASIEVLSGSAVDVDAAMSIQAISGYTGAGDLDIQDDGWDLISAGDNRFKQPGIDLQMKVTGGPILAQRSLFKCFYC